MGSHRCADSGGADPERTPRCTDAGRRNWDGPRMCRDRYAERHVETWGRTLRCAGAGTEPRCAELGEQPRARAQSRARQSCGDAKHRHRREPPSPVPRRASPTHLLQKFGHIIHFVVQDQPGALVVVVFPDLF